MHVTKPYTGIIEIRFGDDIAYRRLHRCMPARRVRLKNISLNNSDLNDQAEIHISLKSRSRKHSDKLPGHWSVCIRYQSNTRPCWQPGWSHLCSQAQALQFASKGGVQTWRIIVWYRGCLANFEEWFLIRDMLLRQEKILAGLWKSKLHKCLIRDLNRLYKSAFVFLRSVFWLW